MASCEGLKLSPLVAKAPLLASPPGKRSPNRGEISLLNLLRTRRMRYLTRIKRGGDGMGIRGDRHYNSDNSASNQIRPRLGEFWGTNPTAHGSLQHTDTGDLASQIVKKAKSRIQRRTQRRKNQPTPPTNEVESPLQSSTNRSPVGRQCPPHSLSNKQPFRLPPIKSRGNLSSSSANTSPDTCSPFFRASPSKVPYSPSCKRALFTRTQSFLTSVSQAQSKEVLLALPQKNEHSRGSKHLPCSRRLVYLSDPQSPPCNDGSPSAPPATPCPDINSSVCFVPPLHDTKVTYKAIHV